MNDKLGVYNPGESRDTNPGEYRVTGGNTPKRNSMQNKIALSAIPFTPVPLAGPSAPYGWGRLLLYGGLTYATWKRARKLSYVFGGMTGISAVSSLTSHAWQRAENG